MEYQVTYLVDEWFLSQRKSIAVHQQSWKLLWRIIKILDRLFARLLFKSRLVDIN